MANSLSYDEKTDRYTRTVNGKKYTVSKNDSRYKKIAAEYSGQSGTSGGSGNLPGGGNQINAVGGSGKSYTYNPASGGISVNGKVITPGTSGYAATRAAMLNDGVNIGGKTNANTGGAATNQSAGQGSLRLGDDGVTLIRSVGGKDYAVGKNDSRYGAIYQEYLDQQKPATAAEEVSIYDIYKEQMEKAYQLQNQAYENQLAAARQAADTAKDELNRSYDQAAQNAYINMMQEKAALPQQLAALGLSGTGISETAALNNTADYQNTLNANELERAEKLAALYDKLMATEAAGGVSQAELAANLYSQLAAAAMNQANADRSYNYQLARDAVSDQRYADELRRAYQEQVFASLLDQGIVTDAMAQFYGVNRGALEAYVNAMNAQSGGYSGSSSSRSSGSSGGGSSAGSSYSGSSGGSYSGLSDNAIMGFANQFLSNNLAELASVPGVGIYGPLEVYMKSLQSNYDISDNDALKIYNQILAGLE